MDDKELISKIKYSRKSGMSRADITRKLQAKGYKLEYINALIGRSQRSGKILVIALIVIIVLAALAFAAYSYLFASQGEKLDIANPLAGLLVSFDSQPTQASGNQTLTEINIDDVEITPEFLTYLLNEIGAWKLHRNKLTGEAAMINFEIPGDKTYNAEVDDGIVTEEGASSDPDIEFVAPKEDIVRAILDDNPGEYFKNSITDGTTQMNVIAPETELFTKGYLDLYGELK